MNCLFCQQLQYSCTEDKEDMPRVYVHTRTSASILGATVRLQFELEVLRCLCIDEGDGTLIIVCVCVRVCVGLCVCARAPARL